MIQEKLSPAARTIVRWISKTSRVDWHTEKQQIGCAYNKDFSEHLLSKAEVEHIESLIIARDREVSSARAGSQIQLGASAAGAVRSVQKTARARDGTKIPGSARKIRTAEEHQRYAEKRGRRAYLAKIGIIPANILRNACYSTCLQAVLACIAWEVINTGSCQKPVALLAANAAVSRRSVQMALRRAAEDGLIVVVRRKRMPNRVIIIDESWNRWIGTWIYMQSKTDNNCDDSYRGAETCTPQSARLSASSSRPPTAERWSLTGRRREQPDSDDQCADARENAQVIAGLAPSALEECLAALETLVLADHRPGQRVDRSNCG